MRKVPKLKQALSSYLFPVFQYFPRTCCSCFPWFGEAKVRHFIFSSQNFFACFLETALLLLLASLNLPAPSR
jgi:hypothetical protein